MWPRDTAQASGVTERHFTAKNLQDSVRKPANFCKFMSFCWFFATIFEFLQS